jgi:carboxyl-terminal processing protease
MIRKLSTLAAGAVVGAGLVLVGQGNLPSIGIAQAAGPETYRQLELFGDVFERIRADYVEEPDDKALIEAAISGMLTSLDPHSGFLPPEDAQDMRVQTSGEFGGLGIEVTMEEGLVKVVAPIDDTPAQRAGLLTDDLIVEIDGQQVLGLELPDAVDLMRGPVDTDVTLRVQREGAPELIEFTLTRAVIRVQSVRSRVEDDIGYIRIASFTEQTFEGLEEAVAQIQDAIPAERLRGYVLDLRGNPGGLLDQAILVSDALLEQGEIVSTRGRHSEQTRRYSARAGDIFDDAPVIVLINGGSASASEIVAGALQDHRRATILGTRSFGKASVQSIIDLGEEGSMRLTTARYYTPAGTSIQARGIAPDIVVEQVLPPELQDLVEARSESSLRGHLSTEAEDGEQSGSIAYVPEDPAEDTQLNTAYELLRGEQANSAFPPDETAGVPN